MKGYMTFSIDCPRVQYLGSTRWLSYFQSECLAVLPNPTLMANHLQLHDENLVSAAAEGRLRIKSTETLALLQNIAAHNKSATAMTTSGTKIATGISDGQVRIWKPRLRVLILEFGNFVGSIWEMAVKRGGLCVASYKDS